MSEKAKFRKRSINWVGATVLALGAAGQSLGQSSPPLSDTKPSGESENAVTPLMTLPLSEDAEFTNSADKATEDGFDQAVLPFTLNEDWALITRNNFPAMSQPPKQLGEDWRSGLANGYTTFFLSSEQGIGFYWIVGSVLYYPIATNQGLNVNKWGRGSSAALTEKEIATLVGLGVAGQPARVSPPLSDTELSKESENPLTRLITLPLRYVARFNSGPYKATRDTFEIDQAVLPFKLNEDWALITRTRLPAESQPPKKLGENWASGLANGYTSFFLSPEHGQGFYWGVGPLLYYPSATNKALGVNKWGSGPSLVFLKRDQSPWMLGVVVNNIWSFGGPPHSSDRTNRFLLNPFASYHFSYGWSVDSSPDIVANWLSKRGQQWTVPIGGGVGKVLRIGEQKIKLSVDSYYNSIRPQAGNRNWEIKFTVTFQFPLD